MSRSAQISRTTNETDISLSLTLDGSGAGTRTTGVGFFDHMLDALARHGRMDLEVQATGDLQTGAHHTVEDVGLVIGQALDEALADRSGIARCPAAARSSIATTRSGARSSCRTTS